MEKSNQKPQPPADNECCQGGCNPCVWDNYYAKLKQWRFEQVKIRDLKTLSEE